jgi:hypothetical protein
MAVSGKKWLSESSKFHISKGTTISDNQNPIFRRIVVIFIRRPGSIQRPPPAAACRRHSAGGERPFG